VLTISGCFSNGAANSVAALHFAYCPACEAMGPTACSDYMRPGIMPGCIMPGCIMPGCIIMEGAPG